MTLLDSSNSESQIENQARSRILLGIVAALVVTALVFAGYSLLRKRHQQRVLAAEQARVIPSTEPKGPPKVQILVDEALLKGDQSLLGGTVKNISNENLNDLAVSLELIRRKDGGTDRVAAPVDPGQLAPQQEGHYSLQIHAADYLSVRLAGLKSGANPELLIYVAGPGQKRPPEKLAARTIIVPRPGSSKGKGGFLNTPDNPGRVP
ncbi:MAG TPA: hypothetical protein VN643_02040 [Pyrinomonadaceae bacterium]|nr:hypothetical protein [Pyrinomonadaceae bacterium]